MYWLSITNFSKFMFWNCFFYDKKNFCHIFKNEIVKKRKLIKKIINVMNKRLKSIMKIEWKFNNAIRRLALNNLKKMKFQWRWNKNHDKIKRKIKNDIDWFRYQKQIFFSYLMSFALKCQKNKSNILVMKNDVLSHASKMQNQWIIIFLFNDVCWFYRVFMNINVMKLLWCDNSLDLNMIKFCWWWMKRKVDEKNEFTFIQQALNSLIDSDISKTKKNMTTTFKRLWYKKLTQTRIQHWIERMSRYIQKIIELREENEYRKKSTNVIMINEHDEIVEISNKDHVRSYNLEEKRLIYTRRKANVKSRYKNKWMNLKFNISQTSHVNVLRQWRNFIKTTTKFNIKMRLSLIE